MNPSRAKKLRTELDALYERFNDPAYLVGDPLGRIAPELSPADFEIVSFVAAGLSYGRVEQIRRSIDAYLALSATAFGTGRHGEGLAMRLASLAGKRDELRAEKAYASWKHRLQTGQDLKALSMRLGSALREHGSLAKLFQHSHASDPKSQLASFSSALGGESRKAKANSDVWTGWGLSSFCPSPADGSACKRLLMWLRWMVRKDRIDPGIWQIPSMIDPMLPLPSPAQLFHPVDTHIFNWARAQRLVERKSPGWPLVEELSAVMAQLSPGDPTRYDFAITQEGMRIFRA
jgi:uncharacterized protein (TIGR02757 family)